MPAAFIMTTNNGMVRTMNATQAAMSIRRRPKESDRCPMRKIAAMYTTSIIEVAKVEVSWENPSSS